LFLRLAALAAVVLAAGAARLAGGTWPAALASAVVAAIAVFLASRNRTTDEQMADIGRGAIVGMILAFTAAWVDHEAAERSKRDQRAATELSERQSLAITLSSGKGFAGIDLHGQDLSGFYVAGKDLSKADLHAVRFEGAVLRGTTFKGANMRRARLSSADLSDANLNGSDLTRASLARATMKRAKLGGARLVGADLRGANLEGAVLTFADLRRAKLQGAILVGADLSLALLVEANLRGAVFSADLRDARLDGAALAGAQWDVNTRWKEEGGRFDPDEHIAKTLRKSRITFPKSARSDRVERVIDGDTLVLERERRVRLLGIGAPTSDYKPRECYGRRATAAVVRLLPKGEVVRYWPGSPEEDKFGRALLYLWLPNGLFVNEAIVERGAATVLIPDSKGPYSKRHNRYVPNLQRAEVRAASHRRGLWRACRR
jgi:uncharacterized protein YjbI with pentapeptide repeats/endonuclease YncB( thermonuclease family)